MRRKTKKQRGDLKKKERMKTERGGGTNWKKRRRKNHKETGEVLQTNEKQRGVVLRIEGHDQNRREKKGKKNIEE